MESYEFQIPGTHNGLEIAMGIISENSKAKISGSLSY